ncbi:MAG: hypothetical protein ACSLFK_04955 [Gemmatimonadaceae bacterium]
MIKRAIAVWFGIMLLAITNGAVRESLVTPRFGPQQGHVISTLLLASAIVAVAFITIRWIGPANAAQAWRAGIMWLAFTLAFEFLAGHYVFGTPWETILADYNLLEGRIWPLVPLATLIAPAWAFTRLRQHSFQ